MAKLDVELYAAQRSGERAAHIACLLERSQLWARYRELLVEIGAESTGAALAGQRDQADAFALQREVKP